MKMRLRLFLNRLIARTGLIVVRKEQYYHEVGIPVELSPFEKDAIYRFSPFSMTSFARLSAIAISMKYINENIIEGALVECGVWAGGSIGLAAFLSQQNGETRDVVLFDTFQGMTAPSVDDSLEAHEGYKNTLMDDGTSSWCAVNLADVKTNLASAGIEMDNLNFVVGDVSVTLTEKSNIPEKIAFLRLDTDWFQSTYDELIHLYPRLVPGAIVIIDDFGAWEGARSAVVKYFVENRLHPLMLPIDNTGRIFIKK
jgi:O-methyltransferase